MKNPNVCPTYIFCYFDIYNFVDSPIGGNTLTEYSQRGNPPPTNECPENDIKQSDSEVPVMPELSGMPSTPSLPLLPCPLWPERVAPAKVLCMGWIEVFDI